jgi:hypothetical protein
MTIPHCFGSRSFIVTFEIMKCECFDFANIFQDFFDYLGPLAIPYDFEDQLSHFYWGILEFW